MTGQPNENPEPQQERIPVSESATDKQLDFIMQLQEQLHDFTTAGAFLREKHKEKIADLTKREASELIDRFLARKSGV